MRELDKLLLMFLGLLVSRQYRLAAGEDAPWFFDLLREPPEFFFHWRDRAFRLEADEAALPMLRASVLFVEERRFAAPVSSLAHHLQLARTSPGVVTATLAAAMTEALHIEDVDEVYAAYSPFHLLYTSGAGFFRPRNERWHQYAGRAVAARLGGEARIGDGASEACCGDARFLFSDLADVLRMEASTAQGFIFAIDIGKRSFDATVTSPPAWLASAVRAFCAQDPMPAGVTAELSGTSMRLRGGC